jgi:diguanylate cyclase (GGDEF)-like protein
MHNPAYSSNLVPIGYKTKLDDRLKVVLDGMPVGVTWARIEDGSIEYMNRRFRQMIGYTADELPTVYDFFSTCFADPAKAAQAGAATRLLLATDHLVEMEIPAQEIELVARDGTRRCVAFGGTILPEAGWMVATFLDQSDRKERERLMARLAEEDPLTGLLNRRSFDAALTEALVLRKSGRSVHMILLDLDGFKQVNDRFGHAIGDLLLKRIATALSQVFRAEDSFSRIGGDEFAAIITVPDGGYRVADILQRIEIIFAEPFAIEGERVRLGISAGVASAPEDTDEALELYKKADRAMYAAKATRKLRD